MKRRTIKIKDKKLTLAAHLLLYFFAFADYMPLPLESKGQYTRRIFSGKSHTYIYYKIIKKLEEKGWIKMYADGQSKKFKLTNEGRLETLFIKAQLETPKVWDGKWRMVIFDIPEEDRQQRNRLRFLLKVNGFQQIQKSVFVNPYPLNRDALTYLRETGLDEFIRVFRIDQVDNEAKLKKQFNL